MEKHVLVKKECLQTGLEIDLKQIGFKSLLKLNNMKKKVMQFSSDDHYSKAK